MLIVGGKEISCRATVMDWHVHGLEFRATDDGNRPRNPKKTKIDLGVLHWTGSENSPETMFHVLQNRDLGVEFAIDHLGVIWQFCDPLVVDTFDAGYINRRSWGCEIVSVGSAPNAKKFPRERRDEKVNGRKASHAIFVPAQVEAAIALCDAMCEALSIPRRVPKNILGGLKTDTLNPKDVASWSGILGHFHVNADKRDPGTGLFEEMIRRGY